MKRVKPIILIQLLVYLSNGLFAPAWYKILITRGGTLDQFGFLLGLTVFGTVIASYVAGQLSNSRNPYLVLAVGISFEAILLLAYIPEGSVQVLYVLQVLYGAIGAAILTIEQVIVAQLSRGHGNVIGSYNSIMQGAMGGSMIAGGVAASYVGIVPIIEVSAVLLVIAVIASFFNLKREGV